MRKLFYLLVIFLVCVQFLTADEHQELAEVVVSASRIETSTLEAPAFASVVYLSQPGTAGLLNALKSVPGVYVSDYGLAGSVKTVRMRGSGSAQVLILVDGVKLNSERDGQIDLGLIPTANIDRIEVVRGGGSSVYGSDAIGGVVNIITKKAKTNSFTVSILNGSYIPLAGKKVKEGMVEESTDANFLDLLDTQKIEVSGTAKVGEAGITAGGSFTRANEGFVWQDDTYINDYRRSVNSDYLAGTANLGVSLPVFGGELNFKGDVSLSERGVPGMLFDNWGTLSTDARQKDTYASFAGSYINESFLDYSGVLDVKTFARYKNLVYSNPPDPESDHKEFAFGLDAAHTTHFDFVSLVAGVSALYDSADSTDIGRKDRTNLAAFVSLPVYLPGGNFSVTPQVRADWYSDFGTAFSAKFSGVYLLSDSASLKINGSYSFRAPTLNDLYWPVDSWGTHGNPNLKPEQAYAFDTGVEFSAEHLKGSAAAFLHYAADEIQWGDDPATPDPFDFTPLNLGATFVPGLELYLSFDLSSGFFADVNYTFMYSFLLKDAAGNSLSFSDNKRVSYRPMHTGGIKVGWKNSSNRVSVSGDVVSSQYTNAANTDILEGHAVFNAEYERKFSDTVKASFAVKNIFNTVYENQKGYLAPPISFWAGMSLNF